MDDDEDEPVEGPEPEPLALPDALPIALVDESLPVSEFCHPFACAISMCHPFHVPCTLDGLPTMTGYSQQDEPT